MLASSITAAVAVKIPPFIYQDLSSWFLLCDAQFTICAISSEFTKSSHIVANLPTDTDTRVSQWILQQPDPSKIAYERLREELLRLYDIPASARARKLLSFPSLGVGDRDPSRLSEEMFLLSRCADGSEVDLLMEVYLQTLPKHVRDQMGDTQGLTLKQLGARAQTIWLQTSAPSFSTVAAIDTTDVEINEDHLRSDRDAICAIQNQQQRRRSREFQRKPPINLAKQREPTFNALGHCFYHSQFGKAARQCVQGCTFQKNFNSGRRF